jgi:hypothetical protein
MPSIGTETFDRIIGAAIRQMLRSFGRALRESVSDNVCEFQKGMFFNDTATTEIYTQSNTLSLHDALPI